MEVSREQFEELVAEAIDGMHARFQNLIAHVVFVVEDVPSSDQLTSLEETDGELILGLFEGPTMAEEKIAPWTLPPKITIFKKSSELEAKSHDDLRRIVRETVWHEVAHYLGMDEDEVTRAEERRGSSHA